jgi:hypothetical protein
VDTAPKASGCFLGGTQEIFGGVSEELLGGAAKAEDAKVPGVGIIPKPCPMKRVRTERMNRNNFYRFTDEPELQREESETGRSKFLGAGTEGAGRDAGIARSNSLNGSTMHGPTVGHGYRRPAPATCSFWIRPNPFSQPLALM